MVYPKQKEINLRGRTGSFFSFLEEGEENMIKEVIKRDGQVVPFNKEKIRTAVFKAMDEVGYKQKELVDCIIYPIEKMSQERLSVEEIQDEVETLLIQCKMVEVAKAYIRYRYKRNEERAKDAEIMKRVQEKLDGKTIENSNANMDEASAGGKVGSVAETILKQHALDYCMSKMARENHLNNQIYIHDLSSYSVGLHNCLTMPLDDLLAKGFKVRQTDIRPANSVNTAMQLVAVLFQVQSLNQFGA